MSLFVFSLVLLSASIHVFWNALVKKCEDKASFAWLSHIISVFVFLLPMFIFSRIYWPGLISKQILLLACISGLFEALYIITLYGAYETADLSVVYPLSRGVAPIFILLAAGLFVSDTVNLSGGLAVLIILIGMTSVAFSVKNISSDKSIAKGVLLAIITGAMIAGYHLVDRRAMEFTNRPNPLEYLFIMQCFQLIFLTIWISISPQKRTKIMHEWKINKKGVLIVGLFTPLAYFLIIWALQYGNVTYIAAGRNIGIVISVIAGLLIFREPVGRLRAIGAILITLGIAIMIFFAKT